MAWQKLATKTLTGASNDITTDAFTTKKFIHLICHIISGAANEPAFRYNSNSGTVYAERFSTNGGVDNTGVSVTRNLVDGANTDQDSLVVGYVINILGQEKLGIYFRCGRGTAGAANAPTREEAIGKFVPSPDADITSVTIFDAVGGTDFATDSNLSALGTD